MYILNSEFIKNKIGFKEKVSHYLETHGVPLLCIEGGIYYFAETELLNGVLKSKETPLWVKLAKKYK